jgi:hypothetical protein
MQRQPQQRQDSIVDLVLVDIHETRIACTSPEILRPTPDARGRTAKPFFGNGNTSGVALTLQNTAGTCTLTPTSTTASFSCSSDERLNKNIVDAGSALAWIRSFRVREYDLKTTGDHLTGVIAQEVQKNHPEMVHSSDSGILSVDGPNPWMTIKAIQELQAQNDELRLDLRIAEIIGLMSLVGAVLFIWIRTSACGKQAHAI